MLPWISSLCELNPFVAYELDAACATFGIVMRNALQETVEVGSDTNKRTRAKYSLSELLNDEFQFRSDNGLGMFAGLDGYQEVRE